MTEYSKTNNIFILFFLIIPILFITIAVVNIRSINKRLKVVNQLNQKGKLIKNLPYHLENTGIVVNNVQIQRPVVEYTLPSGSTITLYGEPRYDKKAEDTDGMVDIVIDENNPSNYFIDYEINRLSGNLPSDYYNKIPNNEVQSNDMNYQINNQNQNITNNNMNSNIVPENNTNIQQNPTITQQEQSQNQIVQNNNEQFNINSDNNPQNNMF